MFAICGKYGGIIQDLGLEVKGKVGRTTDERHRTQDTGDVLVGGEGRARKLKS